MKAWVCGACVTERRITCVDPAAGHTHAGPGTVL
jgi:hypothetical protein